MKNEKRYTFLSAAASAVLFLCIAVPAHAGFGVSPGVIKEDRLVPGASLERTIFLVQGNQTEDVLIEASVESKDIAGWITFVNGSSFTIPARTQQFAMPVKIAIPKDAPLGIYRANIKVNTVPAKADNAQITVALGAKVAVELTVGDDLYSEFSIRDIDILDVSEGDDPLVAMVVTNTGNVPVSPDRATFELYNKFGDVRLGYTESSSFETVSAFEEEKMTVPFPIGITLGVGEYWGHVRVYKDNQVVRELRTIFNVTPKSFIEKYWVSFAALALVLAVGAVILLLRRKAR